MEWLSIVLLVYIILRIVRKVWKWMYANIIGPKLFGPAVNFKHMGGWALVTGATDGIGKAYAKQLAKKGLNIILISRTLSKLEILAREIETEYKVQTKVIDVDFTKGDEIYEKIEKQVLGLEVGVLVNNVGLSYPHPDYFLTMSNRDELIAQIIKCNITSVSNMCSIIMPQMVERKRGVVINLSSLAAHIPNPMLSFYAASKAFVDKFSEDLQTEYKSKGIVIQSVLPGYVATNMSKISRPTWMAPSADTYVESALKTLGINAHTTGYYPHALLKLVLLTFESVCPSMAKKTVLKTMENIRKRALKKAATSAGSL